MGFERGADAVTRAVEQQQSGQFGPRLSFFSWKDEDKKVLRFLEDDLPLVGEFAQGIQTNNEKIQTMDFLINPDDNNWVEYFGGMQREWGSGNLITPKLRKMGVGIAVLREEVPDPDNPGRTKIVDALTTVDVDGKKYQARQFGVLKLPLSTFWKKLTGMQRRYGTLCDRDYEITRHGADKTTDYEVTPIDSSDDSMRDPDGVRAQYGYGTKMDEKDPKRFFYCPQTLDEWAAYYSGKERAEYWLKGASNGAEHHANGAMTSSYGTGVVDGLNEFRKETTFNPPNGEQVWGQTAEDEAQPVPSAASGFSGVREQLRSHFANHPSD